MPLIKNSFYTIEDKWVDTKSEAGKDTKRGDIKKKGDLNENLKESMVFKNPKEESKEKSMSARKETKKRDVPDLEIDSNLTDS